MQSLSMDDRLAIANMTTEWGALTGLFPIDSVLQDWLRDKATKAAIFNNHKLPEKTQRFTHRAILVRSAECSSIVCFHAPDIVLNNAAMLHGPLSCRPSELHIR
ncbi:mitochondrial Homoaconitase [Endocarpon pusillum]|uniref:Mitochondrial Homoaconitase n=1 Tax=Endocarpon pusillum TaxID=364733 RepID=A0A8H7AJM5_9EURO|nr:mitochondrial Homoaconitase [Endocarpon pusillum]